VLLGLSEAKDFGQSHEQIDNLQHYGPPRGNFIAEADQSESRRQQIEKQIKQWKQESQTRVLDNPAQASLRDRESDLKKREDALLKLQASLHAKQLSLFQGKEALKQKREAAPHYSTVLTDSSSVNSTLAQGDSQTRRRLTQVTERCEKWQKKLANNSALPNYFHEEGAKGLQATVWLRAPYEHLLPEERKHHILVRCLFLSRIELMHRNAASTCCSNVDQAAKVFSLFQFSQALAIIKLLQYLIY
jgi:hypothetical protein